MYQAPKNKKKFNNLFLTKSQSTVIANLKKQWKWYKPIKYFTVVHNMKVSCSDYLYYIYMYYSKYLAPSHTQCRWCAQRGRGLRRELWPSLPHLRREKFSCSNFLTSTTLNVDPNLLSKYPLEFTVWYLKFEIFFWGKDPKTTQIMGVTYKETHSHNLPKTMSSAYSPSIKVHAPTNKLSRWK